MEKQSLRIADAHCDTLYELCVGGGTFQKNRLSLSRDRLLQYDGYIQFFAAWVDDKAEHPFSSVNSMIDIFYRELAENSDSMMQILSASDFDRAFSDRKIGALLMVENGKALKGSLDKLYELYERGVRGLTLTWNDENELGHGVLSRERGGLTDFGKCVIREMNGLNMMVDVSHLSEKGFWEVINLSQKPVMASHSNAWAVCPHDRNLNDDQIRAIKETGGVIGLNLYPVFLSEKKQAGLTDCLAHINHILSVGGEEVLGLGSDFDGFSGEGVLELEHSGAYKNLFSYLEDHGFSADLLKKISHENLVHYAKRVLT